jgi:hypothetical protein
MRLGLLILVAAVAAAALTGGGCDRSGKNAGVAPSAGQSTARRTEWTADQISKDPAGYLRWSDRQVADHIAANEQRLGALQKSHEQFAGKRDLLLQNIQDVENIRRRLDDAVQRADDEDRWPVRMGDRAFTREKAQAILKQTQQYVDERQPTAAKYDQFLKKLDDTAAAVRAENTRLAELREKIALDLEQVKLNQGNAEVDKLRAAESQLRQMSSAVAALSEDNDPLKAPPPGEPTGRVNIDDMLK